MVEKLIALYERDSDASDDDSFKRDVDKLYEYVAMDTSEVSQIMLEEAHIASGKFYVENGELNSDVKLYVNHINFLKFINFENGLYQTKNLKGLAYPVNSNGKIIDNDEFTGIVWEPDVTNMQLEIKIEPFKKVVPRDLLPYYQQLIQEKN